MSERVRCQVCGSGLIVMTRKFDPTSGTLGFEIECRDCHEKYPSQFLRWGTLSPNEIRQGLGLEPIRDPESGWFTKVTERFGLGGALQAAADKMVQEKPDEKPKRKIKLED